MERSLARLDELFYFVIAENGSTGRSCARENFRIILAKKPFPHSLSFSYAFPPQSLRRGTAVLEN